MAEKKCRACGDPAFRYAILQLDGLDGYEELEHIPGAPGALLCIGCLGCLVEKWHSMVVDSFQGAYDGSDEKGST